MKDNTIEELVLEYISGDLTTDREASLKTLLQKHGYTRAELENLREMYKRLDDIHVPSPGEKMTEGFYQMLETYKREETKKTSVFESLISWLHERHCQKWFVRMACSIALIFAGWLIGRSQTPVVGVARLPPRPGDTRAAPRLPCACGDARSLGQRPLLGACV